MSEHGAREHYLPIRQGELIELLARDPALATEERALFRQLCRLVEAIIHFEYHQHLSRLKDSYAPFDPDAETLPLEPLSEAKRQHWLDKLFAEFAWLVERANYRRLSRNDLETAMTGYTDWGVNLHVDFDCFERLEVYARGDDFSTRLRRRLRRFYRLEEVRLPTYRRLIIMLKQRPHKRLGPNPDTRNVFIKLFKDIPKLDVEMLLPGGQLRMPGIQRLKLSGSLATSIGYIGYKMYHEASHLLYGWLTRNPLLFWGPLSLVLSYGYRQYYGYQQMRQSYSLLLTQSLYYQNLDSNAGVLTRLLDEAEEQECREALLAYFLLWRQAGEEGWELSQLDAAAEQFLRQQTGIDLDFEVGDALVKLERLELVERSGERLRARSLEQALVALDQRWDHFFQYHTPKSTLIEQ